LKNNQEVLEVDPESAANVAQGPVAINECFAYIIQ
jgi:hypothetical protein